MVTTVKEFHTFEGVFWERNIYSSRPIETPAHQTLDCFNECVNAQAGICHFFVLENAICYLGRTDITNGTVAEQNSNVTVYTVTGINYQVYKINKKNFPQNSYFNVLLIW
jgi:hypothetical protein